MNSRTHSHSLAVSERVYRFLLVLYPAEFRHEYADPLVQAFRDSCREAHRDSGTLGVIRMWLPIIGDLVSNASAERILEVLRMSSSDLTGKNLALSVIVGTIWGLLNHFLDDLLGAVPVVGASLTSSDYFVPLVIALWFILSFALIWRIVGLRGSPWTTGITCAVLWMSASVSFHFYDLYRLFPRLSDGTVSLGWGRAAVTALAVLSGFGIGWAIVHLHNRFRSAILA